MPKISVFNHVSMDGYIMDKNGDMSWAHANSHNAEWNAFVEGNASGSSTLVFGRITYEMMAGFWPTAAAAMSMPAVAARMNALRKIVFSRTMTEAQWEHTTLVKKEMLAEVRRLKREPGADMVIMGSGSIVSQLTEARLIDEYHIVISPVILGSGRTMFEGVSKKLHLTLASSRTFGNGNIFLCYDAAR